MPYTMAQKIAAAKADREIVGSMYACPVCDYGLRNPSAVMRHLRFSHEPTWRILREAHGNAPLNKLYKNDATKWAAIKAAVAA